jgi:hypothetical protein
LNDTEFIVAYNKEQDETAKHRNTAPGTVLKSHIKTRGLWEKRNNVITGNMSGDVSSIVFAKSRIVNTAFYYWYWYNVVFPYVKQIRKDSENAIAFVNCGEDMQIKLFSDEEFQKEYDLHYFAIRRYY